MGMGCFRTGCPIPAPAPDIEQEDGGAGVELQGALYIGVAVVEPQGVLDADDAVGGTSAGCVAVVPQQVD